MRAGALRDRAEFQRQATGAIDQYGNVAGAWQELVTVWADLRETKGKESVEAGRLESTVTATLRVRSSSDTRAITPADRVVVRGGTWAIRSGPIQLDAKNTTLEFVIEKGVAT